MEGGGINVITGSVTVTNCTLSGNRAQFGGGISVTGGSAIVTNSTAWANSADPGGGIYVGSGSGISPTPGTVTLINSIVAGNIVHGTTTPSDIVVTGGGALTGSYDLIGTGGSVGLVNGMDGNLVDIANPKLAALGNHGGATPTMPLLFGSLAIDAGSNTLAVGADGNPLATDQRRLPRISGGIVDIGAVEYQWTPGDANKDGKVDFSDLVILARSYGQTSATWAEEDFDGDGKVDFGDLVGLARNYGKSASATPAQADDRPSLWKRFWLLRQ